MTVLLLVKLLVVFSSHFFLASHAFTDFVPITVCEEFEPHHKRLSGQPLNTTPYMIYVSNMSYVPGAIINVTINGTKDFKGFMVQARRSSSGDSRPVGAFQGELQRSTTYLWCSGGKCNPQNTVAHIHAKGASWRSLTFSWKAPQNSVGNITFWATIVYNYTIFWNHIKSAVLSGPPADPEPNITLEDSFQVTKDGCGADKGCYSEPEDCQNSTDCELLLTYQTKDNNITFEMSGKHGYISFGFNDKQEMNRTECISCSTSDTRAVEVRHYYLDYHQPIRTDLWGFSDLVYHAGAFNDGIITCRFSRKISALPPLRNLTENWFFIFAWGRVSGTGGLKYHRRNASYSAERINVTKPIIMKNGRRAEPVPVPVLEITKEGCRKTKSCYSEPADCSSSGDCDYLVTFKPCGGGNDVEFELSAKNNWAAIGFNSKNKMDGTDTIICSRTDGDTVGIEHYNLVGYDNPTKPTSPSDLKAMAGTYDGGVVRCRFSRKKTSSEMLNLDKEVFLIFARGQVSDNVLLKHTHKSSSTEKVDVCSLVDQLEGSQSKNLNLLRAHGVLMIVAWVGFASIAMYVARYMRQTWGELLGLKAWFQVHRALTISCLVFTIVGFILVFVYAGGWSEHAEAHGILGIIITVMVCGQFIGGLLRPAPSHDMRFIFNWSHRSCGFISFTLAVVNIFLGVRLPHLNITDNGIYAMCVFCVGLVLVIVLEIVLQLKKRIFVRYNQLSMLENPDKEQVQIVEPKSPPKDSFLRTAVLVFLIALVISVCVALIVFIAEGKEE